MNHSQKMRLKRTVSGILAASMSASVFTAVPVYAETGSKTYTYDGYKVDYSVTNEWLGNQNVNVTVTNTSDESILNWALGYDANGEINGIWNGYVYSRSDDEYIIKNSGYNYEIEPYQSVNFGYTLSGDALEMPENFELCSKRVDKTDGYDVKLNVTGDWGDSFQAELIVTNTSDSSLEAWKVAFDSNFEINNLWNGKIIESDDNGYSVASCMWTNPIASGDSTTIGFTASRKDENSPAISNVRVSEVIIDKDNSVVVPVTPGEDTLLITANSVLADDNSTVNVTWNTNVDNGKFEVLYSTDNIEYISAAEVKNTNSYTYSVGDVCGTVYFKVRQTTKGGQIAESDVVSVDIPVPAVSEKPVVTVTADYDEETEFVNISWETTVADGSFDIYAKAPESYFEVIGTVSDATSFSFAPEVSGSYDIKIVQTTAAGMTGESDVVTVLCTIPDPADEIDWDDTTDTDGDELSDIEEKYVYMTDPEDPDTDKDGLPDGYEIYTLDTDPLSADTDENGISDADEDIEDDGLTNICEFERGTDPRDEDTDDDGLTDTEEISIYGTDPLKYDTDEDGVSDGDEVALGLDPTSKCSDGTPDNEKTFTQIIPADDWLFYNINVENSPVEVSIEVDAAGVAINNIEATVSGYSYAMNNDAIIGVAPEFSYTDNLKINDVKINFDIKSSVIDDYNNAYNDISDEFVEIKRFNVFRYFEDINMLLPIRTYHDVENNRVYAHYDEMGTYCLIDMTKWLDSLGYMNSRTNQQIASFALNKSSISNSNSIDIVFLMYVQPAQVDFVKSELIKVINTVYDNANDVNIYFMINDGSDVIAYKTSGRDYAMTREEALSIANKLRFPVSNQVYLYKGFKAVSEISLRDDAQKHFFLIDGVFEPRTDTENVYLNRILGKEVNFGVVCDVVNSNLTYYRNVAEGNVKNSHIMFSSFITEQINFPINTDKDYIITSNGLTAISEDFGAITADSTQDYDDDGLSDVTEINFEAVSESGKKLITVNPDNSVKLPSFNECTAVEGTYVEEGLIRFYNEADESVLELLDDIKVLPLNSDPTAPDGDGDGVSDADEYEIAFVLMCNAKSSEDSQKPLYQNSIINMYGFNKTISSNMREKEKIIPYYSLAVEKGVSVKGRKDYGYLGSYNDVFYLEAFCNRDEKGNVISNDLRIHANLKFNDNELKIIASQDSKGNKKYETDTVTKAEIINEIKNRWSKKINGDLYDFYGMNVNVTVEIHEINRGYKPLKYATYYLNDKKGNGLTNPLTMKSKKVQIYNERSFGFQTQTMILDTCAHEFGHVLGLADIYATFENFYTIPVPYNTISEIQFKPNNDAKSLIREKSIMNIRGEVSNNELEMAIFTAKEAEPQFFVPWGRTRKKDESNTHTQSLAIRDTYFYQYIPPKSDKKEYRVFTNNKWEPVESLSESDLIKCICLDKESYISIYKKTFGNNVAEEIINEEYNKYYNGKKAYAHALFKNVS